MHCIYEYVDDGGWHVPRDRNPALLIAVTAFIPKCSVRLQTSYRYSIYFLGLDIVLKLRLCLFTYILPFTSYCEPRQGFEFLDQKFHLEWKPFKTFALWAWKSPCGTQSCRARISVPKSLGIPTVRYKMHGAAFAGALRLCTSFEPDWTDQGSDHTDFQMHYDAL